MGVERKRKENLNKKEGDIRNQSTNDEINFKKVKEKV